jgi:prefoldin alpha subunit
MEDEKQSALNLLGIYESQMEALSNQSALIALSLNETMQAIRTISSYKDVEEAEEILVPVGGDIFIRGYAKKSDKALFRVGRDIFIDKPFDPVIKELEERRGKLEELRKRVESDLNAIKNEVARLLGQIQYRV